MEWHLHLRGAAASHRPQTISELQQLIATARPPLHALGTRHSFNGVADAAGLITLQSLAGSITIDEDARTVSVPAGIRYGDLARRLQDSGWAREQSPVSAAHLGRRFGSNGNAWLRQRQSVLGLRGDGS